MIYPDIPLVRIDGISDNFSNYTGYISLVVNVASLCGHTKQYTVLESLYRKYKEKKFVILGFPCNQFGEQEPSSNLEINEFCRLNYDISFPLFQKTDVNGPNEHKIYNYLKTKNSMCLDDTTIKWNFTKFIVDRNGEVLLRIQPGEMPLNILEKIIIN